MTPIEYFTENHKAILEAYTLANGQVKQTWNELNNNTLPDLAETMSYNSFKAYLPAFAAGFNLAMNQVKQVEQTDLAELERVKQELNRKQTELESVQAELHQVKQVKQVMVEQPDQEAPKTVDGWSVQYSGGYYRAFRKINGRVEGVYLGKYFDHDQAKAKIQAKERQLQAKSSNESSTLDFDNQ